jgi:4-hydroxy-tetrahydrodipicolinate synthase
VDVATIQRLSAVPNIAGVKEASGNMTQMCEICAAVPDEFLVLSGDDALTLPVMSVGGRGIVSVASNEVPGEMAKMVELAESGDFAGARRIHQELLPLMQINFIESSPIPVKAAMSMMGLLEEVYRLPLVPPRPASRDRIANVLRDLGLPAGPATVRA